MLLTIPPSIVAWIFLAFSAIFLFFEPIWFTDLSYTFFNNNVDLFICVRIVGSVFLSSATIIIFFGRKAINQRITGELIKEGIFRFIRHPLYTGYCLYFFSFFLLFPSIVTVFLLLGIYGYYKTAVYEEQTLVNHFGVEYTNYCKTTGRFVPKLFSKKI